MTTTSVHGVPITPALAAACRELLAGVASARAWVEIAPLIAESARRYTGVSPESDGEGKRHPPFGELYTVEAPPLHALASCALGTACTRCSAPIEDHVHASRETVSWRAVGWWAEPPCSAMEQVLTVDMLAGEGPKETKMKRPNYAGALNHMWKGGLSVASNGYRLVRVGKEHHLADVRGYAYEHRVVAEAKLGRRLLPGEHVHHEDGDRLNNAPENLHVMSTAEHGVAHRKVDRGRRLPGEANKERLCACGCGTKLATFDGMNRPRRFIHGHNARAQ